MIPEYKRDTVKPLDFEKLSEEMPDIANLIASQDTWSQFEQLPDLSDIPAEYQKMIPQNVRDGKEDTRVYNMWLTKQ